MQGYKDAQFAERMFTYYYRIFDKYSQPLTAFAIFTDSHKGYRPNLYETSYLGTELSYKYNTYKIRDQDEVALLASDNPFALVVLTANAALKADKLTEDELLILKLSIAKRLLNSQIPKSKVRSILNFLRYYVRLENPLANSKFEKEIDSITHSNKTMGIDEFLLDRAKKEGIEQGKQHIIAQLLKKTTFSAEQIADIAGVSVSLVEKIRKKLPSGLL